MTTATMDSVIPITGRQTKPIYVWAFFGVLCLLLQVYIYGSWILSDKFAPVDPGPTPISDLSMGFAYAFQTCGVIGFFWVVIWGIRSYRREGYVTTSYLFFVGWLLAYWQDPIANWYRLYYNYNSYMFNMGSWVEFVPGWIMPRGSNIPEPLLFDIGGYMSWVPLFSVAIAIGMRKAKQRWPKIGTLELLGVALVMGMIMDLVLEGAFVLTGLYRFTGAVYSWSIWGGEQYQFPVYEAILWGAVWAAGAALWYFKDDKGHMWVERGCENIRSATTSVFLRLMVNRPRIPGHRLSLRHLA